MYNVKKTIKYWENTAPIERDEEYPTDLDHQTHLNTVDDILQRIAVKKDGVSSRGITPDAKEDVKGR